MREREAETQAEGEAGSMHREPDVGFDPGSPGSRPGPKAGAKPLRHPGIPRIFHFLDLFLLLSPLVAASFLRVIFTKNIFLILLVSEYIETCE